MKASINKDGRVTLNLTRDEFYDLDRLINNLTPDGRGFMHEEEVYYKKLKIVTTIVFKDDVEHFKNFFTSLFSDKQYRFL